MTILHVLPLLERTGDSTSSLTQMKDKSHSIGTHPLYPRIGSPNRLKGSYPIRGADIAFRTKKRRKTNQPIGLLRPFQPRDRIETS